MMPPLEVIRDGALEGEENMRRDRELFSRYRQGGIPPQLRLYSWSGPTLSLGRFQDERQVSLERCRSLGVEIVRRPTGGRAVLHGPWELTYCFAGGKRDGLPDDLRGAYHWVLQVISRAFAHLEIDATVGYQRSTRSAGRKFSCFSSATQADLVVRGKKICGSAQRREGGDFLQHGSILLNSPEMVEQDLSQSAVKLKQPGQAIGRTSVSEVMGRIVRREDFEDLLITFWREAFATELLPSAESHLKYGVHLSSLMGR